VYTEQNPRGPRFLSACLLHLCLSLHSLALGPTVPELSPTFMDLGPLHLGTVEKTLFSMVTPEVTSILKDHNFQSVCIFGIEVGVSSSAASYGLSFALGLSTA